MQTGAVINLGMLHELALLYLGLAAADADVATTETKEIAMKLRRWQPGRYLRLCGRFS